jgi:hypothetical protein
MIDTYWTVGAHLSNKAANAGWGKGVVQELASWLAAQAPELKGFSASNLLADEAVLRGVSGR